MKFSFLKLVGAGNDFIFVNYKDFKSSKNLPEIAKTFCNRQWGIGADGFVFMEELNLSTGEFRWHFFNNDGSRAEMCGNAARCATLYCFEKYSLSHCHIETLIGPVTGEYSSAHASVSWQLTKPNLIEKTITLENNKTVTGQFINTGVPHFVINQNTYNLNGRDCLLIQQHSEFQPQQTNVTLLELRYGRNFTKSFERGVRNFTLACGTGVIASAFVLQKISTKDIYHLTAPGGELSVQIDGEQVTLIGPAIKTFSGSSAWERG